MRHAAMIPEVRRSSARRGFALVASLALMVLLLVVGMGILSLSALQLRTSEEVFYAERARANARLAVVMAIGQLQKQLGPDTRVSAKAELVDRGGAVKQPQWTGVWSTRMPDGGAVLRRDDASGGLRDRRDPTFREGMRGALGWLVSGEGVNPGQEMRGEVMEVVGAGTVGTASSAGRVVVPAVAVDAAVAGGRGRIAWWTGDLGVKANVATVDVHEGKQPDPAAAADGGWFRLLASQEADSRLLEGSPDWQAQEKSRLASVKTLGEAWPGSPAGALFHELTVHSEGVQANVSDGRLKRDLTAFIASGGKIDDWRGLPGIRDDDRLAGPANEAAAVAAGVAWDKNRHRDSAPRFGLLRKWANSGAPFEDRAVAAMPPKFDERARVPGDLSMALANERPASIADFDTPDLFPVLVEGTYSWTMSWHRNVTPTSTGAAPQPYQVRNHIYPRVVLWNPWSVPIRMEPCMAMIQGNGRFEMWTDCAYPVSGGIRQFVTQWIGTEGGRDPNFSAAGGVLASSGYNDPFMGSYLFALPETEFKPGETLVFTPARTAEYEREIKPGWKYALEKNLLSCRVAPDPSRNYYVSNAEIDGGMFFYPTTYWFAPTNYSGWNQGGRKGIENQGDDCRVILKHLGRRTNVTFEDFDELPQIAVVSASLQYGGGREPRIAWNSNEKMPCEETDPSNPKPTQVPNVRTREGVRLRWWFETQSNLLNSGALTNTPHFEEALLGNWNPRAAYASRTPWDNIGGSMPVTGYAGGPWFFGAYTRDLYDQAVSWQDQMPVLGSDGRCHGNPFGTPQQGQERIVLFDVPRADVGVLSLGQFQHAKLSPFVWHPSYVVGQSLVDPRLGGFDRTAPVYANHNEESTGGFDREAIGWSSDTQRAAGPDAWAAQGRAIYQNWPETESLVYDISFEVNQALWDDFFLSTGDAEAKREWLESRGRKPLPNGRVRLASGTGVPRDPVDLTDLHRAASRLTIDGAFNVNSTSVTAWKAVLGATRRLGDGKSAAFPRVLNAPGKNWASGDPADDPDAWSGTRRLTDAEIDRLAREIVVQVKERGPFLSLADFVNRRLSNDETGRRGALQAAIEAAGLNRVFDEDYALDNKRSLPDYRHPDNIRDATRFEQMHKPSSKVWGVPGYLTQGDLLQVLGPVLSARSDTFVIRACGEAHDPAGRVRGRAWCEAVVQRTPRPLDPDASGINPRRTAREGDFGRQFIVKAFRWLRREEV